MNYLFKWSNMYVPTTRQNPMCVERWSCPMDSVSSNKTPGTQLQWTRQAVLGLATITLLKSVSGSLTIADLRIQCLWPMGTDVHACGSQVVVGNSGTFYWVISLSIYPSHSSTPNRAFLKILMDQKAAVGTEESSQRDSTLVLYSPPPGLILILSTQLFIQRSPDLSLPSARTEDAYRELVGTWNCYWDRLKLALMCLLLTLIYATTNIFIGIMGREIDGIC